MNLESKASGTDHVKWLFKLAVPVSQKSVSSVSGSLRHTTEEGKSAWAKRLEQLM